LARAGADVGYGEMAQIQITAKNSSPVAASPESNTGDTFCHYRPATKMFTTKISDHEGDLPITAKKHHVVLTAPERLLLHSRRQNGRNSLSAQALVKTTWATSYDLQTSKQF